MAYTAEQIGQMNVFELDQAVTGIMIDISGDMHGLRPFSSHEVTALELWDFASDMLGDVALIRFADAPKALRFQVTIRDVEDDQRSVQTAGSSWAECLARAVVYAYYEHYGYYPSGEYEKAISDASRTFH